MHRYRIDEGKYCIDIQLRDWQQLFDSRDPAPFHDRDLDDDAVAYIINSMLEIPKNSGVKIVLTLPRQVSVHANEDTVRSGIQMHFAYQQELNRGRIRERFREGQAAFIIGVTCLSVFISLAQLVGTVGHSVVNEILHEGLTIMGWVAMWRPIDIFLYSWWPLFRSSGIYGRLAKVEVDFIYV